jgi:hypothetical protein
MSDSFASYLAAKKTVDDRALNKDVFARVRAEVAANRAEPLRVLEVGAGLGTMVARLVDWRLADRVAYTLLDGDSQVLAGSRDWLAGWAKSAGHELAIDANGVRVRGANGLEWSLHFIHAEIGDYIERRSQVRDADLLVANAFLDLADVPTMLPELAGLVRAGGLFWFAINFDGDTIFEPSHEHDQAFLATFHRSMDDRIRGGQPSGDSRTGRHLFQHLRAIGASILAAGSSDWVVFGNGGRYPADEALFLRHIVRIVEDELKRDQQINPTDLSNWVQTRRHQIDRGELVYIAHQIDLCGRFVSRQSMSARRNH